MDVLIENVASRMMVEATIRQAKPTELPSLHEGWRFNLNKEAPKRNRTAYVLCTKEHPERIEGCLIFEMVDGIIPYMAYLESAPHNKYADKRFDCVAGCLIAFAFRLTDLAKGDYKNLLQFEVSEDTEKAQQKLMAHYCKCYGAKHWYGTRGYMMIYDEDGELLIKKYLSPHKEQ